jgi:hypothetical protein
MINEDILGGRTNKEFIDFMSDMLITDNALANNILKEHFNLYTTDCYNLRINIILEYLNKKEKLKNNGNI